MRKLIGSLVCLALVPTVIRTSEFAVLTPGELFELNTSSLRWPSHPAALPDQGGAKAASSSTSNGLTLVQDTTQYPYSAIGALILQYADGTQGLCSASLISSTVVLTAAHCAWDPDGGVSPIQGYFLPAWNPAWTNSLPEGMANVTGFCYPSSFQQCGRSGYTECHAQWDVAVMYLSGGVHGVSTLQYGLNSSLAGAETITTAGYPGQMCNDARGTCEMYYTTCPSSTYNPNTAVGMDNCISSPGQSGSPLWLYFPATGQYLVVGVLTFGPANPTSSSGQFTGYTSITSTLYANLQQWVGQVPTA